MMFFDGISIHIHEYMGGIRFLGFKETMTMVRALTMTAGTELI